MVFYPKFPPFDDVSMTLCLDLLFAILGIKSDESLESDGDH